MFIFILAPRMEFIKCFNQFAGRWKSLYRSHGKRTYDLKIILHFFNIKCIFPK